MRAGQYREKGIKEYENNVYINENRLDQSWPLRVRRVVERKKR
jgi:hypothetical protein